MTGPLRVLDTGLRAADWNIAATAVLVERRAQGLIADTLRFHRYRPSVLIGHGQRADRVVNVDYCRAHGIGVVRRVTGGGAVLMLPGMLAWDVVVGGRQRLRIAQLTERICGAVAQGLVDLGADATFRLPNDIVVGGRKISGSSGYDAQAAAVLQGTVLIEDNAASMALALRLPIAKLRSSVTCLRDVIAATANLPDAMERIASRVAEALGRKGNWGVIESVEEDLATKAIFAAEIDGSLLPVQA